MNVSSGFDKATKRIAVAGALAVTALFPNLAAALEVGQCITPAALKTSLDSEGQKIISGSLTYTEDVHGVVQLPLSKLRYSSNDAGFGYELLARIDPTTNKFECYDVKAKLSDIRVNDYRTRSIGDVFLSRNDQHYNEQFGKMVAGGYVPLLIANKLNSQDKMPGTLVVWLDTPTQEEIDRLKVGMPSLEVNYSGAVATYRAGVGFQHNLSLVNPDIDFDAVPKRILASNPSLAAN